MDALEQARLKLKEAATAGRLRFDEVERLYRSTERLQKRIQEATERLDSMPGSSAAYRALTEEVERQTAECAAQTDKLRALDAQVDVDCQLVSRLMEEVSILSESGRRMDHMAVGGPVITEDSPTTLSEYLRHRHEFECRSTIVTDSELTDGGQVSDPIGKLCPWRITSTLNDRHRKVWQRLPPENVFFTAPHFHSRRELEVRQRAVQPISCDPFLRYFHECTITRGLELLFEVASWYPEVMTALQIDWTFASCDSGTLCMEDMHCCDAPDRYYIAGDQQGRSRPIVALIGKPPHKLPSRSLVRALAGPLDIFAEVLNVPEPKWDEDTRDLWLCRRLVTSVMVELFDAMVRNHIRFGCIYTSEAYVFVRMSEPFGVLETQLYLPRENTIENLGAEFDTTVARLFAFTVEAAQNTSGHDWPMHTLRPWMETSISDIFTEFSIA